MASARPPASSHVAVSPSLTPREVQTSTASPVATSWYSLIPYPIRRVVEFVWWVLVGNLFNEDDRFAEKISKIMFVFFFFSSIGRITSVAWLTEYRETRQWVLAFAGASIYVKSAVGLSAYLYGHCRKSIPKPFLVFYFTLEIVTFFVNDLMRPGYNEVDLILVCFVIAWQLGDLPWQPLGVSLVMVFLVISRVNSGYVHVWMPPSGTPAAVPARNNPNFFPSALLCFTFTVIMNIAAAIENRRAVAVATKAQEFSLRVAQLLGEYDTDAVEMAIEQYALNDEADQGLVSANRVLLSNLQQYRPHLPNYVLPQHFHDKVQDDPESTNPSTNDLNKQAAAEGGAAATSTSARPLTQRSGDRHSARVRPYEASPAISGVSDVYHGVLAVCHCFPRFEVGAGVAAVDVRNQFAIAVQKAADTSGASLHGCLGDCLVTTFNATRRLAKPGTKACRFTSTLGTLLSDMLSSRRLSVTAVVSAGSGRAQFAGNATSQLFILTHSMKEKLASLTLVADRIADVTPFHPQLTTLVDFSTYEDARYEFKLRGVVALDPVSQALPLLPVSPRAASHAGAVSALHQLCFELVGEQETANHERQEWLYNVAAMDDVNDPNNLVTLAAIRHLQGDHHSANEILTQEKLGDVPHTAALSLLKDSVGLGLSSSATQSVVTMEMARSLN